MMKLRLRDTGGEHVGGDGTAHKFKFGLESMGYDVFLVRIAR